MTPTTTNGTPTAAQLLLDRIQVCKLCGISDTTLYRWMDLGVFPKPSHRTGHFVRWRRSDVQAWLDHGAADPGEPQPWKEALDRAATVDAT